MADDADIAADRGEMELAARISAVRMPIAPGVVGECDDCGEVMPRLVGGRCGFCRDGRRPPLATYDRIDGTPPAALKSKKEMPVMPVSNVVTESRKIAIRGRALRAVELRAEERDLSFQESANELIELVIDAGPTETGSSLADAPIEALMAELGRRVSAATPEQLAAANARAEAAERKLIAAATALGMTA